MDAGGSQSFLSPGPEGQALFCSDLVFSSQQNPLLDWALEPDCVSSLSCLRVCVCVTSSR